MSNYRVFVLEDDPQLMELILESLRFSDFDAHGYHNAEELLGDMFGTFSAREIQPDLLIVDLSLDKDKMQGIQFLTELVDRDVSSEVLVISGGGVRGDLERAIGLGIVAVMVKPFSSRDLVKKARVMTEIGRKRRLYRSQVADQTPDLDSTRDWRPVFISYSSEDKNLAMAIRRSLEASGIPVWYAPTTLEVGDFWRRRLKDGIDQATIFIGLISDSYVASPFCLGELTRFHQRMETDQRRRTWILPALAGISSEGKNVEPVKTIVENFHYIDLSVRFIDGLTTLLGRTETILGEEFYGQQLYGSLRSRVASTGS